MGHLKLLSILFGLLLASCSLARAQDVKIIANPGIPADTISIRELKSVFLGETNSLGGVHVEPVLKKHGAVHEAFLREYLSRSDDDLQKYYMALVFSGRGSMPKAEDADDDVIAYVSKTKGAIGYVSAAANTSGVKILNVASSNSPPERRLITRIEPDYPEELQKRAIGGTVRLRLTISANGSVENAELLGGNPVLGESAIAAVSRWKYAPASSRTTAEVSIPFTPNP